MKKHYLVVMVLLVCLGATSGWAQLKSQIQESPSIAEVIRMPGLAPSLSNLSLFDPSRFSMRQSYSLSLATSGGQSASLGMYQNSMSFLLSEKWLLNTRFGFIHDPLKLGGMNMMNTNLFNNLIYGADLTYRPKENVVFNIRFDRMPYYSSYGYRYPYFGY
ncbi:MAG: hypothetical protein V1681_11480 [Candidatus Neomarinimicrobiota bacterium]